MTRFARAQGSKASNARVAEEATPWSEMKQQLIQNTSEKANDETLNRIAKITSSFYSPDKTKLFSEKSSGGNWAEFETTKVPKEKKKKHKNREELKNKTTMVDSLHSVNEGGKIKKKKGKKMKVSKVEALETTEDVQCKKKKDCKIKELFLAKDFQEQLDNKNESNHPIKSKKRRKPIQENRVLFVDGRRIEIENYDNFPVMKEDADRLKELKKKMISQGIPKDEVQRAMKLERRRAEKKLSREGRKLCFHCRKSGHLMSDCPDLGQGTCTVCFKCGSTEHKSVQCHVSHGNDYKFGTCFVCGEQGHIARQCPDNPRGLYPQGGSCRICGDVTHLKKDCPQLAEERRDNAITLGMANKTSALEALDEDVPEKEKPQTPKVNKIIKF